MFDLKSMSLADLLALQKAIPAELEARQREEKLNLLSEFRERARSLGMSLEDVVGTPVGRRSRLSGARVAAKYAHPQNPSLTWSGRGKRPGWVHEWLNSGRSIDELAV